MRSELSRPLCTRTGPFQPSYIRRLALPRVVLTIVTNNHNALRATQVHIAHGAREIRIVQPRRPDLLDRPPASGRQRRESTFEPFLVARIDQDIRLELNSAVIVG